MPHKAPPLFPQFFRCLPVDKPVDNVDKSRYVNSYKRLRNKLCKLKFSNVGRGHDPAAVVIAIVHLPGCALWDDY